MTYIMTLQTQARFSETPGIIIHMKAHARAGDDEQNIN